MQSLLHYMSLNVSWWKRVLSYLYPVRFKQARGMNDIMIGLFLFRNEWQLATTDALYSDGLRYKPLLTAFKELTDKLPFIRSVLVLGAGIGSAVMILDKKGLDPSITMIDHDAVSLQWALELFGEETLRRITPVCADAKEYVQNSTLQYDLVIVDIFNGREVPAFVFEEDFLINCRKCLNNGGAFVMNYIENTKGDWRKVNEKISAVFPANKVRQFDINYIVVATV